MVRASYILMRCW